MAEETPAGTRNKGWLKPGHDPRRYESTPEEQAERARGNRNSIWHQGLVVGGPDDDQIQALLDAAAKGYSNSACAAHADVAVGTLQSWLKRGQALLEKYRQGEELTTEGQFRKAYLAAEWGKARAKGARHLEDTSTDRAEKGLSTWNEPLRKLEAIYRPEWEKRPDRDGAGITIVFASPNGTAGTLDRGDDWEVIEVGPTRAQPELPAAPTADSVPPEPGED